MNTLYTITKRDLLDLFGRLAQKHRVVVPYRRGDRFVFDDFDAAKEAAVELGGIRQSQPVKSFLNPARESVLQGPSHDARPLVLAGVKGCDLSSLALQDFVFLKSDPEDPFYAENRRHTTIIGVDCTAAAETCFCTAVGGAPYPKAHFDLSLAPINDYYLVETGSEKGNALVKEFKLFFKEALGGDAKQRDANREKVARQVREFVEKRGTPDTAQVAGKVKERYDLTALWEEMASTCVECGACNLVCPTCHCFLLYDEKPRAGGLRRYRTWDACLYKSFARVAGEHNPRKHLWERLRNRFDKKFAFFPQVMDYFACTGCGRCIEACPGKIDIREVLKGLVAGSGWKKPPHK